MAGFSRPCCAESRLAGAGRIGGAGAEQTVMAAPGSGPRKWVDLLLVLGVTVILCLPRVRACHDLGEQAYPYRTHYCYADLDCTTGVNDPDVCEFDDCEMSFCHGYYSFCVHHAYWEMFPTCWGTIYCS